MLQLRDICFFVAGAAFFHMISHILLPFYISLPYEFGCITITYGLNNTIIVLSAIVTAVLLYAGVKLKK
jgi:hypothetical protein